MNFVMDNKPLLDAIDLDDEERVVHLLSSDNSISVNSKLSLPGWSGFSLLHWASKQGHLSVIRFLISRGAALSARDENGDTVLHHAARFRRTSVTRELLGLHLVDLNVRNKDGDTALHVAACNGATEVVNELCSTVGVKVNEQNKDGDTPLHQASRNGHVMVIKLLMRCDQIEMNAKNNDGDNPLHLAVSSGKFKCVKVFLMKKCKVDARNKAKLTPLHCACAAKSDYQKEIVEMLVHEGADKNARDEEGNTPLHLAARNGNADAVTALFSKESRVDIMEDVKEMQPEQEIAQVSDVKVQTNLATDQAESVCVSLSTAKLSDAMNTYKLQANEVDQSEHAEISPSLNFMDFFSKEWCLERAVLSTLEALLNACNREGETPLHLAARHGHRSAAEALLELGAATNKHNKYGESPLDYAFDSRHDTVGGVLIRHKAEVSKRMRHELVDMAILEVSKTDIQQLVPRPKIWDLNDGLLLHVTAMAGRTKLLEALLEEGSRNINARNEWRQTPLHCAAILGNTPVVVNLVGRPELKANAEDDKGKTALQYSVECKHSEVEKLLLERADVKECVDRLYRDRQVYVDAANAILVGAALIGSVTYAGWLQPPLGNSYDGYAATEVAGVRVFCVFNSLSFSLAMCTVLAGAGAVLPRPGLCIAAVVRDVQGSLALAALLMVMCVACGVAAFAAAGMAILPPHARGAAWLMGSTIGVGGATVVALVAWFLAKLCALLPRWCAAYWRSWLTGRGSITPEVSSDRPPRLDHNSSCSSFSD